ncbi:unnamed protein product [Ilex paraguariensis]|uniref:Uncharacterized protein n=1 Tax=Ilex paraguariensis TaxID=185542 RepID=A0ABC8U4E2_9AQUA
MAMPSGNAVIYDKMLGGSGGAGGGGEMMHHQRPWLIDERDGFIAWLRGEFAASNAIIDALCNHLRVTGEPGEYDGVVGCIQQRRCNWNPVLHMQQYFSVTEVLYALQQVSWRRQQRYFEPAKVQGKEFRRSGGGGYNRQGHQRVEVVKEGYANAIANDSGNLVGLDKEERVREKDEEAAKVEDKGVALEEEKQGEVGKCCFGGKAFRRPGGLRQRLELHVLSNCLLVYTCNLCAMAQILDEVSKIQADSCINVSGNIQIFISGDSECEARHVDDVCASTSEGTSNMYLENGQSIQIPHEKHNLTNTLKTFVGTEIFDGKTVNVVDGMKLYEEMLNDSEVSKLVALEEKMMVTVKDGEVAGKSRVDNK